MQKAAGALCKNLRSAQKRRRAGILCRLRTGLREYQWKTRSCRFQKLAAHIKESGLAHEYNAKEHLLRIAKFTRGEATSFFVFNEAPNAVQETLSLPVSGKYIAADLLNGVYARGETADGTVELALEAGQSVILIFGSATEDEWAGFPEKSEGLHMAEIETLWDIDLRETGKETEFKPFRKNSKPFLTSRAKR